MVPMFMSQIEKRLPGTTTGAVDTKKPPVIQVVRNWVPKEASKVVQETRTCGVRLPLNVHAELVKEAERRGVSLKALALEYILVEHNRRR